MATFIVALSFLTLQADYISLIRADQCETIAEIFIDENTIRLSLEIGERDYQHFKWIIPEEHFEGGFKPKERSQSLRKFFAETFVITADGRVLSGELVNLRHIPRNYRSSLYTDKVDTAGLDISSHVIHAEFIYRVNNPKKLSFRPPMTKDSKASLSNIGFVTYHKKIPVNDLRYLSVEETLHLNSEDPWYSRFENRNIARHHKNSLMSFLYVDPYEIRHEVLVRLKDLDQWIELQYGIDDVLEVTELDSIKNLVADFLIKRNDVYIDGIKGSPTLDKVHFVEVKLSGIQIQEIPAALNYSSAIIGVIFVFPHDSIPQQVNVNWDLWSKQVQTVPCVMTDPAGPMPYNISPDDSVLVWKNYMKNYQLPNVSEIQVSQASLKIPFITLILLGLVVFQVRRKMIGKTQKMRWGWLILAVLVGLIGLVIHITIPVPFMQKKNFSTPEAKELIGSLLKNTYRAFDFRKESDVYDKLSVSMEGELLSEIYIQTKRSMVLEQQGGIMVKLKSVDLLDVEAVDAEELKDDALAYQCEWVVEGNVGHWGHLHRRINQYQALMKINPVDGLWKMYDLEIIEETRTL